MKNSVTVKAYCKINLSLDIKGVRSDGKHEVDMVMQSLPLYDILEIRKIEASNNEIMLRTNAEWVPTDNRNTAYKAAELLRRDFSQIDCGTEIFIDRECRDVGG